MKMRFSLCLIALGLTAQLVGQNDPADVHISLKETVQIIYLKLIWSHHIN